jgi:NAD(P)H-nitrite reductase large subunit
MEHIVIIGNGVSGVTLARHIRKLSMKRITIISNENQFFFSRTALMYVFMGHLKFEHTQPFENDFWRKNDIDLLFDNVVKIDAKLKVLYLEDGAILTFTKLIIATGSKPNKFGWPGQDLFGVTGLYHKQDLETLEILSNSCKRAVIVGGGLIGIELAEMLRYRNIEVTFLVRENSFWGGVLTPNESQMINNHILEHKVDLRLNTGLLKILSDDNNKVKGVVTDRNETIECEIVGLTAGVSPNINFLEGSGIEVGKGVKVNRYLETNVKDIFAIGDCAEQVESIGLRRSIEAVWYTGRMMGEVLAQTICGNPMQYSPGHWFNSAKFFDIEYQTYGWVFAKPLENECQIYWKHSYSDKSITISFDKYTDEFLGINVFGIRLRHDFFDKVLTDKKSIDFVIEYLNVANFDPEFFTSNFEEIKASLLHQRASLKK